MCQCESPGEVFAPEKPWAQDKDLATLRFSVLMWSWAKSVFGNSRNWLLQSKQGEATEPWDLLLPRASC